jgi:GT2 family glycosyltransferase
VTGSGGSLALVVVHWNQPQRCERSLARFLDQGVDVRITVVDNGSRHDALLALRDVVAAAGPAVELVEVGANIGFGPAANVGWRRWLGRAASGEWAGEWLGLAPHDALPEPDCLRRLLAAGAARPRAGLIGAEFGDGETPVFDRYFGGITAPAAVTEGWEPAGHPHGTLLVARRPCLEAVGLFDERYFAYCEEADLALRAAALGWETGLVRGAVVRNPYVGSAAPAIDYLQLRNTLLLVQEHSGWYHATIRFALALAQLGAGLVSPSRRGPYWNVEGRVMALRDFVTRRFGPPPSHLLTSTSAAFPAQRASERAVSPS